MWRASSRSKASSWNGTSFGDRCQPASLARKQRGEAVARIGVDQVQPAIKCRHLRNDRGRCATRERLGGRIDRAARRRIGIEGGLVDPDLGSRRNIPVQHVEKCVEFGAVEMMQKGVDQDAGPGPVERGPNTGRSDLIMREGIKPLTCSPFARQCNLAGRKVGAGDPQLSPANRLSDPARAAAKFHHMGLVTTGRKELARPLQIAPPRDMRHLVVELPHLGDEGSILVPPLLLKASDFGSRSIRALDGFRWCRHGRIP